MLRTSAVLALRAELVGDHHDVLLPSGAASATSDIAESLRCRGTKLRQRPTATRAAERRISRCVRGETHEPSSDESGPPEAVSQGLVCVRSAASPARSRITTLPEYSTESASPARQEPIPSNGQVLVDHLAVELVD